MKTTTGFIGICALLAWFGTGAYAAENPIPDTQLSVDPTAASLVGSLGRKEALVFEGNTTFTADQINAGLRQQIQFHLAAHPSALLEDYVAKLQEMLHAGYQRQGFPGVKVTVEPEPGAGRILVKITEGPRYKTGQIHFKGVKAIEDPAVQRTLVAALSGWQQTESTGATNALKALWPEQGFAPFDENSIEELKDRTIQELETLNFYRPRLQLAIEPDEKEKKADLIIEMQDEGLKGAIEEISILYPIPEKRNTDQEVLDLLGLKAGMPFRAGLLSDVTNRLWQSGRYFHHEAELRPLPEVGKFKLELRLEEAEDAPPLKQSLKTNEVAFLRLATWINEFEKHPEDLVLRAESALTNTGLVKIQFAVAKSGLALKIDLAPSNAAPRFMYAVVLSEKVNGFYSSWRQRKLVSQGKNAFQFFATVLPNPKATKPSEYMLTVGAGFGSKESQQPVSLGLTVAPSKFLSFAREPGFAYSISGGALTSSFKDHVSELVTDVSIDLQTGRLLEYATSAKTNNASVSLRLHSEEGAYARLVSEIAAATSGWKNEYRAEYPKSSSLGFLLTDLFDSGVLESSFYSNYVASTGNEFTNVSMLAREIRHGLTRLKAALGKEDLAQCLMPLEQKLASAFKPALDSDEREDIFSIPQPPDEMKSQMGMVFALVGSYLVHKSDVVWVRESWPWTLTREAGFTLAGRNKYTTGELERLLHSPQTGPLGCWAASALLSRFNAPLAEKFARRGLGQMTMDRFRGDLDVLLAPEAGAGIVLAEVLSWAGKLNQSDLDAIDGAAGGKSSAFLREAAQLLKAGSNRPPAEVLGPALERSWEPLIKPWLASKLADWQSKVGTPTSPEAAFQRAAFIAQSATKPEDFREAFRFLLMAADQGLAKAQVQAGTLFQTGSQGVPQDYSKALEYYLKAAEQNEKHASCRVADMYFQGLGVHQDKAVAMKWYEREGTNECARSQFFLAQCAEEQSKPVEALAWYRRAATNGMVQAAMALGDRLGDDLTGTPDYAEAYFWYQFATEKGLRVAAAPAKRLKGKLTQTQIEQADQEIARLVRNSPETDSSPQFQRRWQ